MACMIINVYSGHPAIVTKQQFATIKIDNAACLRHEVSHIIPAASVESEHTKNVCFNSRLCNRNETFCRPFMSPTSPVTPYGLASVTLTSLLEIPGCNIEAFEPVSKIKLLDMPSTQIEIKGVPPSNAILTGGLSTAFRGP